VAVAVVVAAFDHAAMLQACAMTLELAAKAKAPTAALRNLIRDIVGTPL